MKEHLVRNDINRYGVTLLNADITRPNNISSFNNCRRGKKVQSLRQTTTSLGTTSPWKITHRRKTKIHILNFSKQKHRVLHNRVFSNITSVIKSSPPPLPTSPF